MAAAFFNTPEKSVVSLFHDPPGLRGTCSKLAFLPSPCGPVPSDLSARTQTWAGLTDARLSTRGLAAGLAVLGPAAGSQA